MAKNNSITRERAAQACREIITLVRVAQIADQLDWDEWVEQLNDCLKLLDGIEQLLPPSYRWDDPRATRLTATGSLAAALESICLDNRRVARETIQKHSPPPEIFDPRFDLTEFDLFEHLMRRAAQMVSRQWLQQLEVERQMIGQSSESVTLGVSAWDVAFWDADGDESAANSTFTSWSRRKTFGGLPSLGKDPLSGNRKLSEVSVMLEKAVEVLTLSDAEKDDLSNHLTKNARAPRLDPKP